MQIESFARGVEERFWSVVDRDGLTGLPSDMWSALDLLTTRAARADNLLAHLEYAVKLFGAFPALNSTAQVDAMRTAIANARGPHANPCPHPEIYDRGECCGKCFAPPQPGL